MRKWIIENTSVTEEEYNSVIPFGDIYFLKLEESSLSDEEVDKINYDYLEKMIKEKNILPFEKGKIISFISRFTLLVRDNPIYNYLLAKIMGIEKDGINWVYKGYKFSELSYFVDKINKKVLRSKNRYGKCHDMALAILYAIENTTLVLGVLTDQYGIEYFHSVVRHSDDIIDYTKNLIMDEKDYQELTNFRILREIKKDDMKVYRDEFFKLHNEEKAYVLCHEFYLWPEEILEGMRKLSGNNRK